MQVPATTVLVGIASRLPFLMRIPHTVPEVRLIKAGQLDRLMISYLGG